MLHYRDLHSFPTRRSSDLCVQTRQWCRSAKGACGDLHEEPARWDAPRVRLRFAGVVRTGGWFCHSRSEEHTSELQSHSDLVCRLLLEKKKKYNMMENTAGQ